MAGPVVVAAILTPRGFYPRRSTLPRLRDSKKLSAGQREVWFNYIKSHPKIIYSTARIYPRKIEKINIVRCTNLAALKAFQRLNLEGKSPPVLLDGGLHLGNGDKKLRLAKTIIKGDEKFIAIKLASIVAKVTRDRYMVKISQRHPRYQLHLHKGYGTLLHRRTLKRFGPSETHRLTYLHK